MESRVVGWNGIPLRINGLPFSAPIENHTILLTTRNNTTLTNFISRDNGQSFSTNTDLSTLMFGALYAPYLFITPNAQHLMAGWYDGGTFSKFAWSHDNGITWDSSTQAYTSDGNLRCSDDGMYMIKGSFDNAAGQGALNSSDGGNTWVFFEPSIGADNRKFVTPEISPDGKYMKITSQYQVAGPVKTVFSSNYGSNVARLEDIDNPSYPFVDGYSLTTNPTMSQDGMLQGIMEPDGRKFKLNL